MTELIFKPYTVVGAYDRTHPDKKLGWVEHVMAATPYDASQEAVCEAAHVELGDDDGNGRTPDDEWMLRMETTYTIAVIEGHHDAMLPGDGDEDFTTPELIEPAVEVSDLDPAAARDHMHALAAAAASRGVTPGALALGD